MEQIRLLLVDDHWIVRAGLRMLLERCDGFQVVGEATTGEEAVELAGTLQPDVVLMDLDMPGMGGVAATRLLVAQQPAVKVLVLTMHSEQMQLLPALRAGANGFVQKTAPQEHLLEAIQRVAADEVVIGADATSMLVEAFRAMPEPPGEKERVASLSEREREVMSLMARGYSPSEISEKLSLSRKTVDTYRVRVMEKLELTRKWQLVEVALKSSLLEVR